MPATSEPKSFATRLAALRQSRGWNRNQLAVAAGLARIHVSRLERGDRQPTVTTLRKLAEALDVKIDKLL